MHISYISTWVKLRYNKLGSPIEFKHLVALNLFVFGKYNIIYYLFLIFNATRYLNLIGEPNILHLSTVPKFYPSTLHQIFSLESHLLLHSYNCEIDLASIYFR